MTKYFSLFAAMLAFAGSARAQAYWPRGTDAQVAEGKKNYMMIALRAINRRGSGFRWYSRRWPNRLTWNGNPERFAAIILKGQIGPFKVDEKPYNNVMPPQEAMLTDDKIASIMTFVRANFGNTSGPVTAEVVAAARKRFIDRVSSWTLPELDAWKDDAAAPAK